MRAIIILLIIGIAAYFIIEDMKQPVTDSTIKESKNIEKQTTPIKNTPIIESKAENNKSPIKDIDTFQSWLFKNKIPVGFAGVIIMGLLAIFFTKRYFDNL